MLDFDDRFLSIKEFAAKMKVHHHTIRRAIVRGKIQAVNIGTGKRSIYRIPISEVGRIALFDLEEMINRIIEERKC